MIDAPAPYVWLAPTRANDGAFASSRADEADDARVRAWVRARGATVTRPEPAPALPLDAALALSLASGVETELAKAREALAALDVASLEAALGRAESTLREHPELPEAAWLRAEVSRAWASRYSRAQPRDDARAARAWKRAAALDGGRVAGIGEIALGAPELVSVALRYVPAPNVEVRVDGKKLGPGPVALGEGEHQIVALRAGRPIWATWAGVAKGAVLTLPSFAPSPCTEEDFSEVRGVRAPNQTRVSAASVSCARWFVVVGGSAIAQCRGDTCGPFVALSAPRMVSPAFASTPPASREPATAQSRWLTWGAVGLGVLITSGSLVAASGVFDKPARESRWVAGGLKVE